MPALLEANQVGKPTDWSNVIAEVEVPGVMYTSMVPKERRPKQTDLHWQAKLPKATPHVGVVDNKDAENFTSNGRYELVGRVQKSWDLPAISDFADEAEIAGLAKGEWAEQIADSAIAVKRIIEKRCLSQYDQLADNGTTTGNETRGCFSWVSPTAQTLNPVPTALLPGSDQQYTGTLGDFQEDDLGDLLQAAFINRRGPATMDGIVGIKLKRKISGFSRYDDTVTGKANVRRFDQDDSKAVINVIDRLVMDPGVVNLHLSPFLYTARTTGNDQDQTHRSGLFLEMDMLFLAFTRAARFRKLEDKGGGPRGIMDVIFLNGCYAPSNQCSAVISADA